MKTEKDKLIDFLDDLIENYDSRLSSILVDARIIKNKLKSINPRNETDGHRRLEDNKDKKEICPKCNSGEWLMNQLGNYSCMKCFHKWTN